ncbi:glycosyl hydrolase [Antarcticirhabdus aurantiaca]|uniref:Glycosyl hydrolase n=2 Tax=Antarcticirhabdus aurantiaca TaxID=2606717 RepID=A0ACD4NQR7_9HYPH|nr:glycosyl hydrolase [Jeongeuplla avenae]
MRLGTPSGLGVLLAAVAFTAMGGPLRPADAMELGVQTHFSQGWPIEALDEAVALKAPALRDSLPWNQGEPSRGTYAIKERSSHIRAICEAGLDVMLTLVPENRNYDNGETVHTDEGRRAFADYVRAVLDQGPDCIVAVEIGNEINGKGGIKGPAAQDVPHSYTALLKAVYDAVKPDHPDVAILGGSTNVIGTGFLEQLFEAGALEAMDAVVVHPYRSHPENVALELDRLKAAMARHGGEKPIWATEFSDNYATPELAASGLVKMTALMSAAGVERAYWYALRDQRWFRNMGLLRPNGATKPAARAFELAQALLREGPARSDDMGQSLIKRVVFGETAQVVWGAPFAIEVPEGARVVDVEGREVRPPYRLGEDPLIVLGSADLTLGSGPVVADTLLQFAQEPWSYLAATPKSKEETLSMNDWEWTSYLGSRWLRPLRINDSSLAPSGDPADPNRPVVRYTAPAAQSVTLSACFAKEEKGDGVEVEIRRNDEVLRSETVTSDLSFDDLALDLQAGDRLDLVVGPNKENGGDVLRYRLRLFAPGEAAAPTPC